MPPSIRGPATMAALFVSALLLRSAAFFQSGLGDESLYLLVAREWLDGRLPYVDIVDNKPPGIYVIFALAQVLLGRNVLAIRVLACVAVTASAWLLLRVGDSLRRPSGFPTGVVAAGLYLFHSVGMGGLESTTELFYTPLVIGGLWLVWDKGAGLTSPAIPSPRRAALIGLLLGTGCLIKTVVVFDFAAAGLIVLHQVWLACRNQQQSPLGPLARTASVIVAAGLLPLAAAAAYFARVGHLAAFLHYNFGANLVHRSDSRFAFGHFAVVVKEQLLAHPLLWFPLLIAAFLALRGLVGTALRRFTAYAFVWLAFAFLGVAFTKLFYQHYFLQLLAAQCLVSAVVMAELLAAVAPPLRAFALGLVLIGPLTSIVYLPLAAAAKQGHARLIKHEPDAGDTAAAMGRYLRARVAPEHSIYVADYKPILYYLVPSRLPSRFVFPEFLNNDHFARVAGADPVPELEMILARAPAYIIRRRALDTPYYRRLDEALRADYTLDRAFEEADARDWMLAETPEQDRFIEVYRRN